MKESPHNLEATRSWQTFNGAQPMVGVTKKDASPADSRLDVQQIEFRNALSLVEPSHLILGERYQLEERLGFGGMGAVYKARHLLLKSTHAIKIIFSDLVTNDPTLVARFRQEAIATAAIRHSNVVAVTDFGVASGNLPFLVMDYIHGCTLQHYLESKGKLHPVEAIEIMAAICAGVGAAHRLGIVHRDLKPLNIMLEEGRPVREAVKVLDFGLAKIKSGELLGSLVQAHSSGFMGSPFYMAPEQWSDDVPDARADIYSLGIIFYQMLTGDVPFKGPSIPAIMKKHLLSPPPAMDLRDGCASPPIEAVVRRALEKHPDQRLQSVEDFLHQLRRAIDEGNATQAPTLKTREKPKGDETNGRGGQPTMGITTNKDNGDWFNRPHALYADAEEAQTSLAETAALSPADLPHLQQFQREHSKAGFKLSAVKMGLLCVALMLGIGTATSLLYIRFFTKGSISKEPAITASAKEESVTAPSPAPTVVPELKRATAPPHMIYIPSGVFMMGRHATASGANDSAGNEWPAHQVVIDHFMMDKTEVTNGEYAEFVRETNHEPPSNWTEATPPAGEEQWPVTRVTAEDAAAFAAWRSRRDDLSYRLPTEAEWEYVARSCSDELPYPWGTSWMRDVANVGTSSLKAVGSFPAGASHRGVLDLIGNAWEWTTTEASFYEGNNQVLPEREQGWVVVRGGSFKTGAGSVTSTTRGWVPASTEDPTLGFRLVAPAL